MDLVNQYVTSSFLFHTATLTIHHGATLLPLVAHANQCL